MASQAVERQQLSGRCQVMPFFHGFVVFAPHGRFLMASGICRPSMLPSLRAGSLLANTESAPFSRPQPSGEEKAVATARRVRCKGQSVRRTHTRYLIDSVCLPTCACRRARRSSDLVQGDLCSQQLIWCSLVVIELRVAGVLVGGTNTRLLPATIAIN